MPALAAFCDAVLAALDAHAPHLVAHITTAGVVVLATAPVDPDDVPAGSTAAESALWSLRALASELGLAPVNANLTWRDRELFPTAVGSPAPGGAGACGGPARVVTAMRRPAVHPNGEAYDALEVPQWPGGAAAFAVGPRSGGCAAAGSSATGGAAADATAWSTDVEQPLLRRTDGTVHGPVLVTLTAASGSGSVASGSAGTAGSPETVEFWFDGHWLWLYGCQFGDCAGDPGRGPGASWVFRVSRGGGCDDYEVTAVVEVTRAPSGAVTAAAVLGARVGGSPAPAAGTEPAPSPAVAAARRLRAAVAEAEAEPAAAGSAAADVIVLDSDSDPEPDGDDEDIWARQRRRAATGGAGGSPAKRGRAMAHYVVVSDSDSDSDPEPAERTAADPAPKRRADADAEGEAPPAKRPASEGSIIIERDTEAELPLREWLPTCAFAKRKDPERVEECIAALLGHGLDTAGSIVRLGLPKLKDTLAKQIPPVTVAQIFNAAAAEGQASGASSNTAARRPAAELPLCDDDLTVRGYFHGVIASLEAYGGAEVTIRDIAETSSGEPFFVKHCGLPAAEATHIWGAVLAACSAKRRADAEGEAPPAKRPASGASDTPTIAAHVVACDHIE